VIEARQVSVTIDGAAVLRDVSLTLTPSSITALIGPPRGGKTTLLRALAGLAPLTGGAIARDGVAVDLTLPTSLAAWQRDVGMSFQNDALFDVMSVYENVALPLRQRGVDATSLEKRVHARLDEVGLLDAASKLPSMLSGGMRKRVGIARATVHSPRLGLFDDPIAGLDPLSASRTLELIARLVAQEKMAAVVVSHDLAVLLPLASHVVMLLDGAVVYDGAPSALARCEDPAVRQFVSGSDDGPL